MNQRGNSVVVIGGGLVGCWSAWYLLQQGFRVTIVERDCVGSGASSGNCGFVCPSHVLPLAGPGVFWSTLKQLLTPGGAVSIAARFDPGLWGWLWRFARHCNAHCQAKAALGRQQLLVSSMRLYREFICQQKVDPQWQEQGLLLVFRSPAAFDRYRSTVEILQQEYSLPVTAYPGRDVQQLEPSLRAGLGGGWFFPEDTHLRPELLLSQLRDQFEAFGGKIEQGTGVTGIEIQQGRAVAVRTGQQARDADLIVLAAGAETGLFARSLGCSLPVQPGKGYSFTVSAPSDMPRRPMIFEETHVAVTPFVDAFRVGSTMRFAGYDRRIEQHRLRMLRRIAEQHLRIRLPEKLSGAWSGWRPMVYDGLPCIGRSPVSNVIVAAGNGMIGLSTAPATGRLVAELAAEVSPHIDPRPYALSRFS